jgi:response regulator NasT
MTAHGMTEPEAFRWIQRAAMDNRTTMRAVAEVILDSDSGGAPLSADPAKPAAPAAEGNAP